jgi:hypothetical protein
VTRDREAGPVCAECAKNLAVMRSAERGNGEKYAYACGYYD